MATAMKDSEVVEVALITSPMISSLEWRLWPIDSDSSRLSTKQLTHLNAVLLLWCLASCSMRALHCLKTRLRMKWHRRLQQQQPLAAMQLA